nr:unnamed protein product [Callosobruchus analis]
MISWTRASTLFLYSLTYPKRLTLSFVIY